MTLRPQFTRRTQHQELIIENAMFFIYEEISLQKPNVLFNGDQENDTIY